MESTDIFNYVRKLELENGSLKTALAEYQEDECEEEKEHTKEPVGVPFFDSMFLTGLALAALSGVTRSKKTTSPEQPAEKITPENSPEKKSEVKSNGIIICY